MATAEELNAWFKALGPEARYIVHEEGDVTSCQACGGVTGMLLTLEGSPGPSYLELHGTPEQRERYAWKRARLPGQWQLCAGCATTKHLRLEDLAKRAPRAKQETLSGVPKGKRR